MEDENIFYLEMEQELPNQQLKEIIQYDIMNKLNYSNKYKRFRKHINIDDRILSKSPNLSNNNINPPPSTSYNKKLRFFISLFKKEN